MNNILKVMGFNIKSARTRLNYTQEELAEKLNTSDKFISMVERGVSGLSVSNIVSLCKVLDIEPNSLFNGLIDYDDTKDKYIVNSLSTLTQEDKDFLISVIEYVLNKNKR